MKNLYFLFFNESTEAGFPGFINNKKIEALPIFGRYMIKEIHKNMTLKMHEDVLILESFDDLSEALKIIKPDDIVLLARSSNIVCLNSTMADLLLEKQIHHDPVDIIKYRVGMVPSDIYTLYCSSFLKQLSNMEVNKNNSFTRFCSRLFGKILFHNFSKMIDINGWSLLIRNVSEYHATNLLPLKDPTAFKFINLVYRRVETSDQEIKVGRNGFVKNSFLGHGITIEAQVFDSVISNNVKIAKNTKVINSVILSGNEIEENVVIRNAVVLGGKGGKICKDSSIGRFSKLKNEDYPELIKNGITLIGEGIRVPSASKIGSGCFLGANVEYDKPVILNDGSSLCN